MIIKKLYLITILGFLTVNAILFFIRSYYIEFYRSYDVGIEWLSLFFYFILLIVNIVFPFYFANRMDK